MRLYAHDVRPNLGLPVWEPDMKVSGNQKPSVNSQQERHRPVHREQHLPEVKGLKLTALTKQSPVES